MARRMRSTRRQSGRGRERPAPQSRTGVFACPEPSPAGERLEGHGVYPTLGSQAECRMLSPWESRCVKPLRRGRGVCCRSGVPRTVRGAPGGIAVGAKVTKSVFYWKGAGGQRNFGDFIAEFLLEELF